MAELNPIHSADDTTPHGGGSQRGGPGNPVAPIGGTVPGSPGNMIGSGQFGPFGPHPVPEPEMTALAMKILAALRGNRYAFARGGMVRGAGTGHSDSIPAMLSNGEYVVRAAIARHPLVRALLDHLNSGGMVSRGTGYADGGPVFGGAQTALTPYSGYTRPVRQPQGPAADGNSADPWAAFQSGNFGVGDANRLLGIIAGGGGQGAFSPTGDPRIYDMIAQEGARASRAGQIAARNNANLVAPNDPALSGYADVLARQGAADQTQQAVNAARLGQASAAQDYIRQLFGGLSSNNEALGRANQAAAISADQMERQANLRKRGALQDILGELAGGGGSALTTKYA